MAETVLVMAPHPDDESIGCGGMVCLHRQRGDPVHVVFLTSGERGIDGVAADQVRALREKEAEAAAQILQVNGIDFLRLPDLGVGDHLQAGARALASVLDRQTPDLIYLPHPEEAHPDHEASLPLVRQALRLVSGRTPLPELRVYEVWTPMARYGWPEDISPVMRQKLRAVRCYPSQLRAFRYDRAVRGLNQYRGVMAGGCRYAEVFASRDAELPGRDR